MNIAAANVPTAMYALCNPTVVPFETMALKLGSPNGRECTVAASSDRISLLLTTVSTMNSSGRMKIFKETKKKEKNANYKSKECRPDKLNGKWRRRRRRMPNSTWTLVKLLKNKLGCPMWKIFHWCRCCALCVIAFQLQSQQRIHRMRKSHCSRRELFFDLLRSSCTYVPTIIHLRAFILNDRTQSITHLRTFSQ